MITYDLKQLDCQAVVSKFGTHGDLKGHILDGLIGSPFMNVSLTDWNLPRDTERPYIRTIIEPLKQHMSEVYSILGYPAFGFVNIWAQQYEQNSTHEWHTHDSCNFTNIYYVELPEGTPTTEFIDPVTKNILSFKTSEGDILTIPSTFIHRSPPNPSKNRKTIISFNTNVYCSVPE